MRRSWRASTIVAGVLLAVGAGLFHLDQRVYLIRGTLRAADGLAARRIAYAEFAPHPRIGGIVTADLDGDGQRDFVLTAPDRIEALSGADGVLWSIAAEIHLTGKSEREGLPGLHAPGVQIGDPDGHGARDLLFLGTDGTLRWHDAATGAERARLVLPGAPPGAGPWEHLVLGAFEMPGRAALLLQTTSAGTWRHPRHLAAVDVARLAAGEGEAAVLWRRDDFLGAFHGGARLADLDGDGRHEVLGGDILGPDGRQLARLELPRRAHIDAVAAGDLDPDLPGLEVVTLEEGATQRVFLTSTRGPVWEASNAAREPQNLAIGEFDPQRHGLEIWLRSGDDWEQRPWVLGADGARMSDYGLAWTLPKGWSAKGVEEISPVHWDGTGRQDLAAKARHRAGDVLILEPMTGRILLRLDARAERLYVADVAGDWREELIVVEPDGLAIYSNPDPPAEPLRPPLWEDETYRLGKMTWNYYSP